MRRIVGSIMEVVDHGTMVVQDGCGGELMLSNVLFVPTLRANVISVTQLTQVGLSVMFSNIGFGVSNCEHKRLFAATVRGTFWNIFVIGSRFSAQNTVENYSVPDHAQEIPSDDSSDPIPLSEQLQAVRDEVLSLRYMQMQDDDLMTTFIREGLERGRASVRGSEKIFCVKKLLSLSNSSLLLKTLFPPFKMHST